MHIIIVGSGLAGITLAESLHKLKPEATVTVLTRETHGYYARPLLSHGFSRDDVETRIILKSFAALRDSGIGVREGVDVLSLQPEPHTLTLQQGTVTETFWLSLYVCVERTVFFVPSNRTSKREASFQLSQ